MKAVVTLFVFSFAFLFGGEGKSLIPYWFKDTTNTTIIFLSNISNEEVTITITLYDELGQVFDEDSEPGTNFQSLRGIVGNAFSTSGGALGPNITCELRILNVGPTETGFAKIEWTSQGTSQVALIGTVRINHVNPSFISINSHKPF